MTNINVIELEESFDHFSESFENISKNKLPAILIHLVDGRMRIDYYKMNNKECIGNLQLAQFNVIADEMIGFN